MAASLALPALIGDTTAITRLGMGAVDPLAASLRLPHLLVALQSNLHLPNKISWRP